MDEVADSNGVLEHAAILMKGTVEVSLVMRIEVGRGWCVCFFSL